MYKRKNNIIFASAVFAVAMNLVGSNAWAGGFLNIEFANADFSDPPSLVIDNPYWPLRPDGTPRVFTYIGETEEECVIDQISVNDPIGATYPLMTDDVDSPYYDLTAVQVVDTEWVFEEFDDCNVNLLTPDLPDHDPDLAIKEKTLDWYLQDDQQNIWYMGEYSQGFEDDEVECSAYPFDPTGAGIPEECKEGSWEAGIEGGEGDEAVVGVAGIVVPGDSPIAGEPLQNGTYYMQEVAFEAEDMAKILRQHASLSVEDGVEPGDYGNCRKAKEWTALEPGASVEHKWYCHVKDMLGPGLVLIEGVGGGPTEVEVLVDIIPPLPLPTP